MRFQTVKRIPGQDPELVLGALEDSIRAVSSNEVVREGRRITFFGLGPSPRAINRRDTTVIDVKAENGGTIIDADVRFQASAFLGEARQEVVVQEKLNRIFDSMLTHLGLAKWPESVNGHKPHVLVEPILPIEEFHPASEDTRKPELMENHSESAGVEADADAETLPEIVPAVEPELTAEVKATEIGQPEVSADAEVAEISVPEEAPAPEPAVAEQVAPQAPNVAATPVSEPATKPSEEPVATLALKILQQESASSSEKKTEEPETATPVTLVPRTEPRARIKFETLMGESGLQVPSNKVSPRVHAQEATPEASIPQPFSGFEEEDTKTSGWLKWSAWIAAIVVLVVAPAAWLFLPSHRQDEAPQRQAQTQAVPAATPQPASAQPVAAASAPEQPGANEDPAVVVSQWEEALQSRDAAAQAAFYANPVDRYFLRHNVSKEDVLEDRQAAIDKRKGIWTVKMERVKITRPKGAARVSLIKHYIVKEEGSPVSEWFVPSVLLLVRQDGRWQITSERDLGWAASIDELEE